MAAPGKRCQVAVLKAATGGLHSAAIQLINFQQLTHVYLYKPNLWKQDSVSKSNYLVWLSSFGRKRWGYCTHSSPSCSLQSNTISSEKSLPIPWIILEISEQLSMLIKLALQQKFELAGYQQSFGGVVSSLHAVQRLPKSLLTWPGVLVFQGSLLQVSCPDLHTTAFRDCFSAVFQPCLGAMHDTVWD